MAKEAALAGTGAAFLVGWPVIFWMVDNGRAGPIARTLGGALCGVTPFVGALASGIVGLYIRSNDVAYVRWVLTHGPSVPYFGLLTWPWFGWLTVLGIASGVVTLWLSRAVAAPKRQPWALESNHVPPN